MCSDWGSKSYGIGKYDAMSELPMDGTSGIASGAKVPNSHGNHLKRQGMELAIECGDRGEDLVIQCIYIVRRAAELFSVLVKSS